MHSSVHLGWHPGECVSLPTSNWVLTFSELHVHWGEGSGMSQVGRTSRPLASRRNVLWELVSPELQALPTIYTDTLRQQGSSKAGMSQEASASQVAWHSTLQKIPAARGGLRASDSYILSEKTETQTQAHQFFFMRKFNLDTLPGKRIYRN